MTRTMTFTIRRAVEADGPGICRLFCTVFSREMTLEEWRWKYLHNPDGWLSVVAEVEGEVAGHWGGWAAQVLIDGVPHELFSLCDLATHPARRNIGGRHEMFRAMIQEWNQLLRARGAAFAHGFPGPMALGAGKGRDRLHHPVRELRFPLVGDEPDLGVGSDVPGPGFDEVWNAARGLIASGFVRDAARAHWRFSRRPDRRYRMVCDAQTWGVLALHGGDALVVDYLASDARPETFLQLWRNLEGEAARLGARTLVWWEPLAGPWRTLVLRQLERPGATVVDTGLWWATPFVLDETVFASFRDALHFTPAAWDDR